MKILTLLPVFLGVAIHQADAQVTVTALEQNGQALSSSSEVHRLRFDNLKEESSVGVGTAVEYGDELLGFGSVLLEINCGGSLLKFAGKFRVLITAPTPGQSCAVNLRDGTADVLSDQPTEVQSGETTLGTKGTVYGVRVRRGREGRTATQCLVFEGAVAMSQPRRRPFVLAEGNKMALGMQDSPQQLNKTDIVQTADLYARLSLSRAVVAGAAPGISGEPLAALRNSYEKTFQNPALAEARVELATLQHEFRADQEADYNLRRAEVIAVQRNDMKMQARIALSRAVVLQSQGINGPASQELEKAKTLDPGILNRQDLQIYRIDERQLRTIQPDIKIAPSRNIRPPADKIEPRPAPQPDAVYAPAGTTKEMAAPYPDKAYVPAGATKEKAEPRPAPRPDAVGALSRENAEPAPPTSLPAPSGLRIKEAAPAPVAGVARIDPLAPLFDLIAKGSYADAAAGFKRRLAEAKNDALANYGMALALYRQNRFSEASRYAQKALALNRSKPILSKDEIRLCDEMAHRR
jgi:tetratricopeptide (TPR) repeat protein